MYENNCDIKKNIFIRYLDLENKEELKEVVDFLDNSDYSVIQNYPYMSSLFQNPHEKFFFIYCIKDSVIIGTLSFVIYFNRLGNIIQSIPKLAYGGVVSNDINKEEVYKILLDEMIKIGRENNCVLATIGTSILENNIELYHKIFKPDYSKSNFYQLNYLNDTPLNKLNKKSRDSMNRKINKSIINNVEIIKNNLNYFDEWYEIYLQRFSEIGAEPFSYKFLKELSYINMNNNRGDFYFAIYNKSLIGGTLVIYNENVIDYFASSYKTEWMYLNANNYILNEIHKSAITKKIKIFNWESSPNRTGGVYVFKSRWGATEREHYYITKVLGDISKLKLSNIDLIKENYKGYYVLPYNVLIDKN